MFNGSYKIEAGGRIVEDEMHTITAGLMSFMDTIFNRATTYPFTSLRAPAYYIEDPINLFQTICFDDSAVGYDRDMVSLTSQRGGTGISTSLRGMFSLAENPYRLSYDGNSVVITKLFKNISDNPYTVRRIFLNIPFQSKSVTSGSSTKDSYPDGFVGWSSCGFYVIACDSTDFTVGAGEIVSISYRLSFADGIGYYLKSWMIYELTYMARRITDPQYEYYDYKHLSGSVDKSFLAFSYSHRISKNPSHSGMIIGSNGESSVNDYALNARIPMASYSQTSTVTEIAYDESSNAYVYTVKKLIQNATGSPLTIAEIGLTGSFSDDTSDSSLVLLHRSVLAEPVTISAGSSGEVSVAFICPVGSKASILSTPCQGAGTLESPYLVSSLANLRWISLTPSVWGGTFSQTADIDASATGGWELGDGKNGGFSPIGNTTTAFSGKYSGNGHKISNLYISCQSYTGLFGNISGAQILGIELTDSVITGYSSYTGGIVGNAVGSLISDCKTMNVSVQGLVGGNYASCVGLIAGNSKESSIIRCTSRGSLDCIGYPPYIYISGICGRSDSGANFNDCVNYASINSSKSGAYSGISGSMTSSTCFVSCINYGDICCSSNSGNNAGISACMHDAGTVTVEKCVNFGTISGGSSSNSGAVCSSHSSSQQLEVTSCANYGLVSGGSCGLANTTTSSSTATVKNCFNAGRYYRVGTSDRVAPLSSYGKASQTLSVAKIQSSNGVAWNVGGVKDRGFLGTSSTYSGGKPNYYDATISEQTTGAGATAKTTAELKLQATYVGWDFTDTWAIDPAKNSGYPYLKWMEEFVPAEISYYE